MPSRCSPGLHIHDTWDWSVRHPVVRLDFAGGSFKEPANLHEDVMLQLESIEDEMGIPARRVSAPGRLRRLLQMLHRQTGQPVAVLVDEYDKPILDALERCRRWRTPTATTCAACMA